MPELAFFPDPFANALALSLAGGVLAILIAIIFRVLLGLRSSGTEKMDHIGVQMRRGMMAFLWREFAAVLIATLLAGLLVYVLADTGYTDASAGKWALPYLAGGVLTGALCSMLVQFGSTRMAAAASIKTAQAARTSLSYALRNAFASGAVTAFCTVGLALIGLTGTFLFFLLHEGLSLPVVVQSLIGFVVGTSLVSSFARVSSDMVCCSATEGKLLTMKAASKTLLSDQKHPAIIAGYVAGSISGIAGVSSDLFETLVAALFAAIVVGLSLGWRGGGTEGAILFPLFVCTLGILASIIASFVVRTRKGSSEVDSALKNGLFLSSIIVAVGAFFLARNILPAQEWMGVFVALMSGLVLSIVLGMILEYNVCHLYAPVKKIVERSIVGSVSLLASGLSLGSGAMFLCVFFLVVGMGMAFSHAGMYGLSISAVGMLSTLGTTLAMVAFAPVAVAADVIADLSQLPKQVRARTVTLSTAGRISSFIGGGCSTGATFLTGLSLLAAFAVIADLENIDLLQANTLMGLLLGASLPYFFSSLIARSVPRAAASLVKEVARQVKEVKGFSEGTTEGDTSRCIAALTRVSLRKTMAILVFAAALPVLVGVLLGLSALAGLLLGVLLAGVTVTIMQISASAALHSAQYSVETGNVGGEGSDAHKASLLGAAFGQSLAGTGSAVVVIMKLMLTVSLLTAGLYTASGVIG